MLYSPLDLPGEAFLKLYVLLFVAVIALSALIPRVLRPRGRDQMVSDVDQLAVLVGGPVRLCEAVIARLLAARAIAIVGTNGFGILSRQPARTALELSVVNLPNGSTWRDVESAVKPYAEPIARKLAELGLMIDETVFRRIRLLAILPYGLLIGFGLVKCYVGIARDRPTLILIILLVVTLIFMLMRYNRCDRRTQAGINAVNDMKNIKARLRSAPMATEAGMAVALFGTLVLAGSEFERFHQARGTASGDSGGSGCSSGGDSGGGGCGGCGGD